MVSEAMNEDTEGKFKNFGQRKSYAAYDPYNPASQFENLKYEDEMKLRASLVVDVQKKAM